MSASQCNKLLRADPPGPQRRPSSLSLDHRLSAQGGCGDSAAPYNHASTHFRKEEWVSSFCLQIPNSAFCSWELKTVTPNNKDCNFQISFPRKASWAIADQHIFIPANLCLHASHGRELQKERKKWEWSGCWSKYLRNPCRFFFIMYILYKFLKIHAHILNCFCTAKIYLLIIFSIKLWKPFLYLFLSSIEVKSRMSFKKNPQEVLVE